MARKPKNQPQLTRIYLRASTKQQDEERAKQSLLDFADEQNLIVANVYQENASGTELERDELNRLIKDSNDHDIILVEDIDRLSRLNYSDWQKLKARIKNKNLYIVALMIPPTHLIITLSQKEETRWFAMSMTDLVIEMSAINARKNYENIRNRTRQGIDKVLADPTAKAEKYLGRPVDLVKYQEIIDLLDKDVSWRKIAKLLQCSITTIKKAKDWNEQGKPDLNAKFKERNIKRNPKLANTVILPSSEQSDVAEVKTDTDTPVKTKRTKKRTTKQNSDSVEKCDKTNDMFK